MKKELLKKVASGTTTFFATTLPVFATRMVVNAGDVITRVTDEKTAANSAFSNLTGKIEQGGAGIYQIVLTISIIGLLISIVVTFAKLALSHNKNKREETKEHLPYVAIGAIGIFAAGTLLSLAKTVGGAI